MSPLAFYIPPGAGSAFPTPCFRDTNNVNVPVISFEKYSPEVCELEALAARGEVYAVVRLRWKEIEELLKRVMPFQSTFPPAVCNG